MALVVLPRSGYSLRGGIYTYLALGLGLLVLTIVRAVSDRRGKPLNTIVSSVLAVAIFLQSFSLFISTGGGASHPCIREYPSPSKKFVLNLSVCGLMTFKYFYTVTDSNPIIRRKIASGKIVQPIAGKWLDDRFADLNIEWNDEETAIYWELEKYRTTMGNVAYPHGESNPKPPLRGVIFLSFEK
ncbi:MAG: hypothetical protein AB4426_29530 [Xenococcaceae cyanobacterium]